MENKKCSKAPTRKCTVFPLHFPVFNCLSMVKTNPERSTPSSIRLWNKEIHRIQGLALLQQAVLVYGVSQWRSSWELKKPVFHWI
jgi:hypothetical protein